jgi:uncharacterized membrane protein
MSHASNPSRGWVIAFWAFTALFCLEMSFTAYWELAIVKQSVPEFTRIGFPSPAFRVELTVAKVLGVLALLLPVPARAKEWAYCGFALNLVSALIAHAAIHDIPVSYAPASITSLLWLGSYLSWRKLQRVG